MTGGRVGEIKPDPIVLHLEYQPIVFLVEDDDDAAGLGVTLHIGQGLAREQEELEGNRGLKVGGIEIPRE